MIESNTIPKKNDSIITITSRRIETIEEIRYRKQAINTENLGIQKTELWAKKFPTVIDKVLQIIKEDEYARENYLWLLLRYYHLNGQISILVPQKDFMGMNSPETISRAKRKLFEEAKNGEPTLKFLLNDALNPKLEEQEKEVRKYFAEDKLQ